VNPAISLQITPPNKSVINNKTAILFIIDFKSGISNMTKYGSLRVAHALRSQRLPWKCFNS